MKCCILWGALCISIMSLGTALPTYAQAEPPTGETTVSPESVNCNTVLASKASAIYVRINGQSVSSIDYCEQSLMPPASALSDKVSFTPIDASSLDSLLSPKVAAPVNLGKPYFIDANTVCREENSGLQLVCLSKEQAQKTWGNLLR